MLQENVMPFLTALKKNNNKVWFNEHRNNYENAKADFLIFVGALIKEIASFDKSIGELEPKNCTFRINRDVRFSKNKSPYKQNMAAYFNKAGKKGLGAGYYVHIEPGSSFIAAGIWMPEAEHLAAIRQEIDYYFDDFKKILNTAAFKNNFPKGPNQENSLVRPPKGYDENNPAIAFLKLKSFVVTTAYPDKQLPEPSLPKEIGKTLKSAAPFVSFLNRSLE
jgi:uncharacterized protein (TIGR02453 family)